MVDPWLQPVRRPGMFGLRPALPGPLPAEILRKPSALPHRSSAPEFTPSPEPIWLQMSRTGLTTPRATTGGCSRAVLNRLQQPSDAWVAGMMAHLLQPSPLITHRCPSQALGFYLASSAVLCCFGGGWEKP